MYYIEYKTTVWQRAKFKDKKSLEEAINLIKSGFIEDIFEEEAGFVQNDVLFYTSEFVEKKDNLNLPTVEAYEDSELIWTN